VIGGIGKFNSAPVLRMRSFEELRRLNDQPATLKGHDPAPSSRSKACRDQAGIHFPG
jgi:hypothetical protein